MKPRKLGSSTVPSKPCDAELADYAQRLGTSVEALRGPSRLAPIVAIRARIAKRLFREGFTWKSIGRAMNRDHTSVRALVIPTQHKTGRRPS